MAPCARSKRSAAADRFSASGDGPRRWERSVAVTVPGAITRFLGCALLACMSLIHTGRSEQRRAVAGRPETLLPCPGLGSALTLGGNERCWGTFFLSVNLAKGRRGIGSYG